MLICFLFLLVLRGGTGAVGPGTQREPVEPLVACEQSPAPQKFAKPLVCTTPSDSLSKPSFPDDNTKSSRGSLQEDAKRPVDVTTVSVNMGNIGGGLSSSTFRLRTAEGKIDGATLSESASKTLDVNTVNDSGEKTSVVQSLSSTVDVFPKAGEDDLLINGCTTHTLGMTTSDGQHSVAVMKDVVSSTTQVNGSGSMRGVANHSLNTATLDREGAASVMKETAGLTSQVNVPEGGDNPTVSASTWRSVGMATGMMNKDTASLNTINLNSTNAYQRRPLDGSVNNDLLIQCQQQIEVLRMKLRRCQAQQGCSAKTLRCY